MRRDTQIGVILGVVIIGIIAVFLSTRTNVSESLDNGSTHNNNGGKEVVFEDTVDLLEEDTFIKGTFESEIKDIAATKKENKIVDTIKNVEELEDIEVVEIGAETKTETLEKKSKSFVPNKKEKEIIVAESAPIQLPEKKKPVNEIAKNDDITTSIIRKEKKVLTHKVERNDSLNSLAKRYYGDSKRWLKIYDANTDVIYDRNSLPVGEELIIPDVEILNVAKVEEVVTIKQLTKGTDPSSKKGQKGKIHIVKRGDSLYALSKHFYGNTSSWRLIYEANKDTLGNKETLIIGQKLVIPETGLAANTRDKNKTHYAIRSETVTDKANNGKKKRTRKTYTIRRGDTLTKIAKKHYNDENKWRLIFDANKKTIKNSNNIPAGKTIVLP